ncbi:MAG: hypothetical protein HY238_18155 [Acidobacteria bacterium]|nr:hypothetical protein [Acidobacteriota bacterium]
MWAFWSAGLLAYSQTAAWYGDEEYHLLASQLINGGRKPFVDFFYNHPPLYIYWNAGWMKLFGESWRSAHALSALATGAGLLLAARFVFTRLPAPAWRLAGGIAAALLAGLHFKLIQFGTISQAYGLCLFLMVGSFRLTTAAAHREGATAALWAGLCAGAAAASSLLSAPVAPILLLWMLRHNRAGHRLRKCAWFLLGVSVPFLPLAWLATQAPGQVRFGLFEFHLFHRAPSYRASARWNLRVLTGWLHSIQGLLLALLAATGLRFLAHRNEWASRGREEFELCAWLTLGLGVFLAVPYPTHGQYFILLLPFVGILAALGLYEIGSGIRKLPRPAWLVLPAVGLFAAGLVKPALELRPEYTFRWQRMERIAREVNRVTPKGGLVWADEGIYFAARRVPPSGLENSFSHDLRIPPDQVAILRVVPRSRLYEWVAGGRFDTVSSCWGFDPQQDSLGLLRVYARHLELDNCHVFWDQRHLDSR